MTEKNLSPAAGSGTASPDRLMFLVLAAFLLTALAWCTVHPLMDPDIWLHMSFARQLLVTGEFPKTDVFSFTAYGQPWMSSGWAASLFFELIHRAAGPEALVYAVSVLITGCYLLVFFIADRRGSSGWTACLLLLCAIASTLRFTPRPEIFSQLFLAAVLLVLLTGFREEGAARRFWLLPPLFAFWANSHAAFLVGLAPVGLAALTLVFQKRFRARDGLLPLMLCFVSWMANPYGYKIALLSGRIKELPQVRQIVSEWKPMIGADGLNVPWPAFIAFSGLGVIAFAVLIRDLRNRKSPEALAEIGTAALFLGLPFYELRHMALGAIALAIISALHAPIISVPRKAWISLAAVLTLSICLMQFFGLLHFGKAFPSARLDDSLLPVTATRFMKANLPPPQLCNDYGPGGYLMYNLGPETKVFMDGRNDVYPVGVWNDFTAIQTGEMSIDAATAKYRLNSFLVYAKSNDSNQGNLVNRLTKHPGWRLCYFDDSYALFVRVAAGTESYIARHGYRFLSPFDLTRFYAGFDDPTKRDQVLTEITRALRISAGSAKAHLLAGAAARESGDTKSANYHFSAAKEKEPLVTVGTAPM